MHVLVKCNEEALEIRVPGAAHAPTEIQDGAIMERQAEETQL